MAVCLQCGLVSGQLGVPCSCGKGYTVRDEHGNDPIGILGRMIGNKLLPVAVFKDETSTIKYETLQLAVDRTVTMTVVKPERFAIPEVRECFRSVTDKCALIKQPNTPTILEAVDLKDQKTLAITTEPLRGETLLAYLQHAEPNPVVLMHVIHQILQSFSALHKAGILFPKFGINNVQIYRSGSDDSFVKVNGFLEACLTWLTPQASQVEDVFYVGQLVLFLLTGKRPPFDRLDLPQEFAYLYPIIQLFMKALAPSEQRYQSCVEMLEAFEAAFDLNTAQSDPQPEAVQVQEEPQPAQERRQTPVPFEDILWMHRPPTRNR